MKKLISLAFTALFSANVLAQNNTLSLEQALSYALTNNPNIASAKQMMESASHGAAAAKGGYLPRVDIAALAVKIDDPIMLDLNNIRSAIIGAGAASYAGAGGANPGQFRSQLEAQIPSFEKKMLDDTFVRVMATVIQPIFTGFKISANSAVKKLEQTIGETNFQNAKNAVITSAIEDYYRAKFINQVIEIRKDLQSNIENHVSNAQKLFDNGMISKANLLRAEVALADAKKEYQKSLMDKDLACILLTNTIGIDASDKELSSPMEMMKGRQEMEYYTEKAETGNTSLKLLDSKKMMLKQKHKASVGKLLPTVAAVGEYQILQDKLTLIEPEWALGITATVNVFSGGADIQEIKASKAELEALEAQIRDVKNAVRTAIRKYYHQCETAKKDYEALETSKSLADENLKLYQASFREGLATSLEVVDAELALTKIKIDQAKAVFDYNSSYAGLLNICAISEEKFAPEEIK